MRVFKTKWIGRFADREKITDASLAAAAEEAEAGKIDAVLGNGLIKQRVARQGKGKSGGYRMILAFKFKDRAIFMYGFAKNDRSNIGPKELEAFKASAEVWLQTTEEALEVYKADGALVEIEMVQNDKEKNRPDA